MHYHEMRKNDQNHRASVVARVTKDRVRSEGPIRKMQLCELYGPVVKKREVFNAAKLSVCEYIFVPILTFGHG